MFTNTAGYLAMLVSDRFMWHYFAGKQSFIL